MSHAKPLRQIERILTLGYTPNDRVKPMSEEQLKTLIKYDKDMEKNNGLSAFTRRAQLNILMKFAQHTEKQFDKISRDDVEEFIYSLDFTPNTIDNYKIVLKKFYKWLYNTEDAPECVKWLKVKNKNNRKIPDDLLTVEEIRMLVDAADNPRDRCLIFVLYESGCRVGEIVGIRQKDIEIKKTHATIIVNGKTGARKIVLINSIGDLIHWMNVHPKKDINHALFVNNRNPDKALGAPGVQSVLKLAAKRAGIKKNVHPHLLRHSRLTHLAQDHTESELKIIAGWKGNSAMPEVYVHLSSGDIENKMLLNAGIITVEDKKKQDTLKPKTCPRCEEVNPIGARFCYVCGLGLDMDAVKDMETESKTVDSDLVSAMESQFEQMKKSIIDEMLQNLKN